MRFTFKCVPSSVIGVITTGTAPPWDVTDMPRNSTRELLKRPSPRYTMSKLTLLSCVIPFARFWMSVSGGRVDCAEGAGAFGKLPKRVSFEKQVLIVVLP